MNITSLRKKEKKREIHTRSPTKRLGVSQIHSWVYEYEQNMDLIHFHQRLTARLNCLCFFVPGLLCDLLWSDPDKDVQGWGENDRGVSFTFGADVVSKFLNRHDLDLICRAHQVTLVLLCDQGL